MSADIRSLIPAPVTTDESGNPLKYYDYRYPRSEAYEQAVKPLLPPGWELYAVIDHEKDPNVCARDYGATRTDHRAYVTGYRYSDGRPRYLRACFRNQDGERMPDKTFEPHELPEACRWASEKLAEYDQAMASG
jgi:hypothetical protein